MTNEEKCPVCKAPQGLNPHCRECLWALTEGKAGGARLYTREEFEAALLEAVQNVTKSREREQRRSAIQVQDWLNTAIEAAAEALEYGAVQDGDGDLPDGESFALLMGSLLRIWQSLRHLRRLLPPGAPSRAAAEDAPSPEPRGDEDSSGEASGDVVGLDQAERRALERVRQVEARIRNELDLARGAIIGAASLARRGTPANPAGSLQVARELLTAACGSTAPIDELARVIEGGAR